ncbi:MAG: hypothetical protein ACO396_09005, partial [Phycisphaerales bacterium]
MAAGLAVCLGGWSLAGCGPEPASRGSTARTGTSSASESLLAADDQVIDARGVAPAPASRGRW